MSERNMKALSEISIGTMVKIYRLQSNSPLCNRLQELGFCENAIVKCIVNNGNQLICEICNTRIGLHYSIAKNILVAPCE